ncbi:MAG: hypothetical protein Q9216_000637 [Gyalolechia sp. 2 TL-2023]
MSRCYDLSYNDRGSSSSWFRKYHLSGGSDWENKHQRANIAFLIITVLALLSITVGAFTVRRTSSASRNLFTWFIAAISLAIIALTWSFIDAILNEECVSVQRIYVIFDIIFFYFRYIADTLLLAAVLIFMISCIARATPKFSKIHLALCCILGLFFFVLLSLHLAFYVKLVEDGGYTTDDIYNAILRIQLTYDVLYLILVIEILVWGFVLLFSSRAGLGTQKAPRILLLIIGISLFIRQIWLTVMDAINNSNNYTLQYEVQRNSVGLARQMFYYLCTVVVYAALVASMKYTQPQREEPGAITHDVHRAVAEPIPYLPAPPEPSWKRDSLRDHSQDPIYVGPEVRDV